jgi:putative methyltransferase (TIGR04325 family)
MLGRLLDFLPSKRIEGYEHPDLVETVFKKTLAYQPTGSWPEIRGARTVLDFGGGCGRHYKEALRETPDVLWAVVETPAMVIRARELETEKLKFFRSVDAAVEWLGQIDVMHSNGAIQYTPQPLTTLQELCNLNAGRMLWYRLFLGDGTESQVSRLRDNGPGTLKVDRKTVVYKFTRIPRDTFLAAHANYSLRATGDDWFDFVR